MSIKSIMNIALHTVSPETSVKDAAIIMSELSVGAIIVGDAENILGIISERDLMNRVLAAGLHPEETPVNDVMTKNVITINQDESSETAMKIMDEKVLRHLPVVNENGYCIGMLGARDLMRSIVETLESDNEALALALEIFK
jgi:CBS domain-containing protein